MHSILKLKDTSFSPSLYIAPMAGITHAPFRRLLSEFGGYGAIFTEMLSVRALLFEDLHKSPYTKKRPEEGKVWYQLLIGVDDAYLPALDRLNTLNPCAIDINAACPAPEIIKRGAGSALFNNAPRLSLILKDIRAHYTGILSVKCRLGNGEDGWEERFCERIKICEDAGVDAIIVHPRFSFEKLKRRARWEIFNWVCNQTKLPIIANGDIVNPHVATQNPEAFEHSRGIMIGRMAVVKPWILASPAPEAIDYCALWQKMYAYILEDFEPEKALGRIKEFSAYYARNFFFGHHLFSGIQSASTLEIIYERATAFLSSNPQVCAEPTVSGI